jgi:hypothetical protein
MRLADHEIHIFRIYVMSSQGTVKSEMITPLMTVSIIFRNHPNVDGTWNYDQTWEVLTKLDLVLFLVGHG